MLKTVLTVENAKASAAVVYHFARRMEEDEEFFSSESGKACYASFIDAYIALTSLKEDIIQDIPDDIVNELEKAKVIEEEEDHISPEDDCPSKEPLEETCEPAE